MITCEVNNNWN